MVTLSILAITTAKDAKWKLINLLIIQAFMSAGFVGLNLGALQTSDQLRHQGWWGSNTEIGGRRAVPLTILLGCVGGLGVLAMERDAAEKECIPSLRRIDLTGSARGIRYSDGAAFLG